MKTEIHPKYFPKATVICACGNTFVTGATQEEIRVEICAQCHPFYTGEEKLMDIAGRVEKFKSRRAAKVEPKAKEGPREKELERIKNYPADKRGYFLFQRAR